MCCMYTVYSGMQEWVIQIPSIPILVSVLFPSLHLKYFRINFLLLVYIVQCHACVCKLSHYYYAINWLWNAQFTLEQEVHDLWPSHDL